MEKKNAAQGIARGPLRGLFFFFAALDSDMWGAAVRAPSIGYSGKLEGVCTYISRLLRFVWNEPLVQGSPKVTAPFKSRLPVSTRAGSALALALVLARVSFWATAYAYAWIP